MVQRMLLTNVKWASATCASCPWPWRPGRVGELVAREGIVVAHVLTTGDPRVRAAAGSRPEFLTMTATLTSVSGHDGVWSTRVPILLTASGADSRRWESEPVGTHWRVPCRLP